MARFKLRLLGKDGQVIGEKQFNKTRNYEAIELAEHLVQAEAGKWAGYELWRGERILRRHPK